MPPVGKKTSNSQESAKDPQQEGGNVAQIISQLKNDFEAQINRAKKRKSSELSHSDIEELEKILR